MAGTSCDMSTVSFKLDLFVLPGCELSGMDEGGMASHLVQEYCAIYEQGCTAHMSIMDTSVSEMNFLTVPENAAIADGQDVA
jgi:hypothetical protein